MFEVTGRQPSKFLRSVSKSKSRSKSRRSKSNKSSMSNKTRSLSRGGHKQSTLQQPEMIFTTSSGMAKGLFEAKNSQSRNPKRLHKKEYASAVSNDPAKPFSLDFRPGRSQQVLNIEQEFATQQVAQDVLLNTAVDPKITQIFHSRAEKQPKSLYEAPNSAKSTVSRYESALQKRLLEQESKLKVMHENMKIDQDYNKSIKDQLDK